jgi:hypothetical protein
VYVKKTTMTVELWSSNSLSDLKKMNEWMNEW